MFAEEVRIVNRLEELRLRKGWNATEAAEKLGFPKTTYYNYEKGNRQLYPEQLIKIADFYGVSIDYLLGRDERTVVIRSPLDEKYETLDERGRKVVDAVIEVESGAKIVELPKRETKIIPLFVAAAGPGEPVPDEGFDDYEVDADSDANFAVKISGDSMEPYLHDGEVVLCKRKRPEIGELAVIMVNGFLVVKQYITDGLNIYLRSLNRNRKDLDVDIWSSGNDTVVGYGTVIFKKLLLVKQ